MKGDTEWNRLFQCLILDTVGGILKFLLEVDEVGIIITVIIILVEHLSIIFANKFLQMLLIFKMLRRSSLNHRVKLFLKVLHIPRSVAMIPSRCRRTHTLLQILPLLQLHPDHLVLISGGVKNFFVRKR